MTELFSLSDKVAIVTGGAKGIGRAIVESFCNQKAIVYLLDIDEEESNNVIRSLKNQGGVVHYHKCDVADFEEVERVFKEINEQHNRLDILVNNAGVSCIGSVLDTSPKDMDRLYQINIKSVYNCLHHGVKHMKDSKGGAIINVASIASVIGLADRFAYSMSKGAVYTMTFSIAKDYISDNIRCNAIGPARVHTPFVDGFIATHYPGKEKEMFGKLSDSQPIGRMAKPIEIAHLVTYLASDEASFITGSFYPIDGGYITLNT